MGVTTTTTSAATYVPIATYNGSGSSSTISFTSIPQTYTDLILVSNYFYTTNSGSSPYYQVGSGSVDTGTNYSYTILNGNGSTAASHRGSNSSRLYLNWDSLATTTVSQLQISHFFNYTNTNTYKTVLTRTGQGNSGVELSVGLWRSTAAINTILVGVDPNFATTSSFTLYGVKAA